MLDAKMLANGKVARQVSSRAYNPTYKFTSNTEAFSVGEVSAPIVAFGDMEAATVKRELVEYFFGKFRIADTFFGMLQKALTNLCRKRASSD